MKWRARRCRGVGLAAALLVLGACRRDDKAAAPTDAGAEASSHLAWAEWPMPNPKGLGLPHEQGFTVTKVGDAEVVVDDVTHLMWQRTVNDSTYSWDQAIEYCEHLELAGHGDWRLPARIELISLIDFTRSMELSPPSPAIDPEAFPNAPAQWFWSSSPAAGTPSNAWHVYFYFGYVDFDDVGSSFRARCVRS